MPPCSPWDPRKAHRNAIFLVTFLPCAVVPQRKLQFCYHHEILIILAYHRPLPTSCSSSSYPYHAYFFLPIPFVPLPGQNHLNNPFSLRLAPTSVYPRSDLSSFLPICILFSGIPRSFCQSNSSKLNTLVAPLHSRSVHRALEESGITPSLCTSLSTIHHRLNISTEARR